MQTYDIIQVHLGNLIFRKLHFLFNFWKTLLRKIYTQESLVSQESLDGNSSIYLGSLFTLKVHSIASSYFQALFDHFLDPIQLNLS